MATIHAHEERLRPEERGHRDATPRRAPDETQRGQREEQRDGDGRVGDDREHQEEVGGDLDVGHQRSENFP